LAYRRPDGTVDYFESPERDHHDDELLVLALLVVVLTVLGFLVLVAWA
jgi:hypothetical protein